MSVWIDCIFGYVTVSVFFLVRICYITQRTLQEWKEQEFHVQFYTLILKILRDSFSWPIYIIWFGLKNVIGELK